MRNVVPALLGAFLVVLPVSVRAQLVLPSAPPAAQPSASSLSIEWEVTNRFRLFKDERDFRRQAEAMREDGVLGAERRLAKATEGRGWARQTVDRLCLTSAGKLVDICERDGVAESYLSPQDHRVSVALSDTLPDGATCLWTFENGQDPPQKSNVPCNGQIKTRVRSGRPTAATVDIAMPDGTTQRASTEIAVRDLLIAGLGDSVAAGEGNPDRGIALSDEGFCFRRFLGTSFSEYFRPGRAGFKGDKSCEPVTATTGTPAPNDNTAEWQKHSARWMDPACHRSLYGYQIRAALALAIENPQVAVTFLPLACSGATIEDGLFGSQRARECPASGRCSGSSPAQLGQLQEILTRAKRPLDLLLLTIGANDIQFSGLIGNVILQDRTERAFANQGGMVMTPEDSLQVLNAKLPASFAHLRATLKPLVGGNLKRVVFVSYANPALQAPGLTCGGGRDGFDVHPAFSAEPSRLAATARFVSDKFLPALKGLASCTAGALCRDPGNESMTVVDGHQRLFATHGVCARSDEDPVFDRICFSAKGETFEQDPVKAATAPLVCPMRPSDYRPYASRARWVRTADDSYFTAMTYPQGVPVALQPRDIHDATWGILSAVYGGAIHPTAEGQAAMADAALPAMRSLLELEPPTDITAAPLPPPDTAAPAPVPPAAIQQAPLPAPVRPR